MIPAAISQLTTWQTVSENQQTVRLASPFTFGADGSHITFSVFFPTKDSFYITDFNEHIMLAEAYGAKTDKNKYTQLNQTTGVRMASFNEDGEIQSTGHIDDLQFALFDCAKLALSLSFQYEKWLPKFNQARFIAMVEAQLRRYIPAEKIIKDYASTGISGHTIRFPFALITEQRHVLIETVSLNNGKTDWTQIYKIHGKFADNKRIDNNSKRLTIFEAGDQNAFEQASTLLADVSSTRLLTAHTNDTWTLTQLAS